MTDHDVILDSLARYARGVDERDFATVAALFTDDATSTIPSPAATKLEGKELAAWLGRSLAMFRMTQHLLGLPVIDVDGRHGAHAGPGHRDARPEASRRHRDERHVTAPTRTSGRGRPTGWRIRSLRFDSHFAAGHVPRAERDQALPDAAGDGDADGPARRQGRADHRRGARAGRGGSAALRRRGRASVVLGDVLDADGERVAADIGSAALYRHHDVSSEDELARLRAAATRALRTARRARQQRRHPADRADRQSITLEQYRRVIDVNQIGCLLGMQAVIPSMAERGGGAIVNISSTCGLQGTAGLRRLRVEQVRDPRHDQDRGDRARPAQDPRQRHLPGRHRHRDGPRRRLRVVDTSNFFDGLPIPRIGAPDEVARAALFLASDESSYCTGTELRGRRRHARRPDVQSGVARGRPRGLRPKLKHVLLRNSWPTSPRSPVSSPAASHVVQGRAVRLPVVVRDADAVSAMYPVRTAAVRKLLPTPSLHPAEWFPGWAICVLAAIEYKDNDLGSYNEVGVNFLVTYGPRVRRCRSSVVIARRAQRHARRVRAPLAGHDRFSRDAGRDIWGFPKTVDDHHRSRTKATAASAASRRTARTS